MLKQLAFKRIFLESGQTFAVATVPGARMRVVDGIVWATTSGSVDDVWLGAGQEHRVENRGLTVIESATRAIVELLPPIATGASLSRRLFAGFGLLRHCKSANGART